MADLTAVPAQLVQGDRYTITLARSDYPATAGWSLTLAVAGASVETWTSVASGDAHLLTLTAADTALLAPGTYRWRVRATTVAGASETIETGALTVQADLALAAPGDQQSWAEKTLAIVEAVIGNVATAEMKMYMIGGRQVMTLSPDELMRLRAQLKAEVTALSLGTFGTPARFDVVGMR